MAEERRTLASIADLLPTGGSGAPLPFDGAIFDFDDTIALSGPIWHTVDTMFFERRGLPLEPDVPARLAALGFREGAEFVIGRYGFSETPQEIMDEWNELGSELYRENVALRPGVEAYLTALREAGVPVALATTNHPDVLSALAPRIDVDALFDTVVTSVDVSVPKDEPDIYLEAARRIATAPRRTVVFEDIPFGLEAAHRAGFLTVGVISGDVNQDVEAVRAAADLLIDGWEALGNPCGLPEA